MDQGLWLQLALLKGTCNFNATTSFPGAKKPGPYSKSKQLEEDWSQTKLQEICLEVTKKGGF